MFEWPFGITNLILLTGWAFLQVIGRLKGSVFGTRHWRLSGMTLFLATFGAILSTVFSEATSGSRPNEISTREGQLFAIVALVAALFAHFNIRFERHRLELELAPLSILYIFCVVQALTAPTLVTYVLVLPFLYLISGVASFMDRDSSLDQATNLPVVGSGVLFVMLSIGAALMFGRFGTLEIDRLSNVFIAEESRAAYLFSWAVFFAATATLLIKSPLDSSLSLLKQSGSWPLAGYFGTINTIVSIVLLSRLSLMLESSGILNNILESGWPGPYPRLTIVIGLTLLLWTFIVFTTHRALGGLMFAWMLLSAIPILIAGGLDGVEPRGLLLCALFFYALNTNLLVKAMSDLGLSTNSTFSELAERCAQADGFLRVQLYTSLILSSPITSFSCFSIMTLAMSSWSAQPFDLATSASVALVTVTFVLLALNLIAQFVLVSKIMAPTAQGIISGNLSWSQYLWNSILFVPVVIIGLHPKPLYMSILAYISK